MDTRGELNRIKGSAKMTLKSVILTGNLSKVQHLSYKLYPSCEFNTGTWQMCVTSVAFSQVNETSTSQLALINCNIVKDLKMEHNYTIATFYPTLATVLMQCDRKQKQKIDYLPDNWFTINNYSDEVRLYFLHPETKAILKSDVFVVVHLLLKRIA